eukprot:TRINITY_DN1891_c0_g1_i2.p1 TRINITY_DN1891_c0_g1~~TRINITY_DN1891_c0_g1_i2.p1  ORF type:complete len:389 (+),score=120.46 TRINITY_DN1891_c0_g1_i2:101-1267(+)
MDPGIDDDGLGGDPIDSPRPCSAPPELRQALRGGPPVYAVSSVELLTPGNARKRRVLVVTAGFVAIVTGKGRSGADILQIVMLCDLAEVLWERARAGVGDATEIRALLRTHAGVTDPEIVVAMSGADGATTLRTIVRLARARPGNSAVALRPNDGRRGSVLQMRRPGTKCSPKERLRTWERSGSPHRGSPPPTRRGPVQRGPELSPSTWTASPAHSLPSPSPAAAPDPPPAPPPPPLPDFGSVRYDPADPTPARDFLYHWARRGAADGRPAPEQCVPRLLQLLEAESGAGDLQELWERVLVRMRKAYGPPPAPGSGPETAAADETDLRKLREEVASLRAEMRQLTAAAATRSQSPSRVLVSPPRPVAQQQQQHPWLALPAAAQHALLT